MILISAWPVIGSVADMPRARLNYLLQHMGMPGDAAYEAKLDGFDYRRHLRKAIDGKQGAFAALFDYSSEGRLTAVGARQHGEILYNLLRLWGDDYFADILRTRRPNVRQRVVQWIDSQFPSPGWPPDKFPKTYELGPHR